jgi:hypothetical protein
VQNNSSDPTDYLLRLLAPVPTVTAYALGTAVSDSLAGLGDEKDYTVSGSAGQQLYFQGESSASAVTLHLLRPDGQDIGLYITSAADAGPFVLPLDGGYTLTATGGGAFAFRLLDLSSATALGDRPTTLSGTLTPGVSQLYALDGRAGETLSFQVLQGDTLR